MRNRGANAAAPFLSEFASPDDEVDTHAKGLLPAAGRLPAAGAPGAADLWHGVDQLDEHPGGAEQCNTRLRKQPQQWRQHWPRPDMGFSNNYYSGKRAAIASLHLDQRSCITVTNLIAKRSINLSQPFACFSRLAHATVTVGDGG